MLERLCFVLIHGSSAQVQHHLDRHDRLYMQPQTADAPSHRVHARRGPALAIWL
jgi:hypothetical protein